MSDAGVSSLLKYRFQPKSKDKAKLQPSVSTGSSQSSENSPSNPSNQSINHAQDTCSKFTRNIVDDIKSVDTPKHLQPSPLRSKKAAAQGRKGPVISSDEEDDSDGWLSKEKGVKINGVDKRRKPRKRKRRPVMESDSDLSFGEDEEDPFANPDVTSKKSDENLEDNVPKSLKKENKNKQAKPVLYSPPSQIIEWLTVSPSERLQKLAAHFPTRPLTSFKEAVETCYTFNTAVDHVIEHYFDPVKGQGPSQFTSTQESDDYDIQPPAKKRARVLVSDDSFNTDAGDGHDGVVVIDDDEEEDKVDGDTIKARLDFLQDGFPNHPREYLENVLASCDNSVEDATEKLTFQDDLPVIKKAKNLSELRQEKKKKEVRHGRSSGTCDTLSDIEVDEDEEFDSNDSDLEDVVSYDPLRKRILNIFNDATQSELAAVPGCSNKKADVILGLRPFEDWPDLVHKFDRQKTLSVGLIEGCKDMLATRRVVRKLMKRCDKISKDMGHLVTHLTAEDNLTDHKLLQIMKQPKSLNPNFTLKPYQIIGLNWLLVMHKHDVNGILADEMGLGKTIQAISFLAYLIEQGDRGPHLIIVPSSTLNNWHREIQTWCPNMEVLLYYGSQEERRDIRYMYRKAPPGYAAVVLTTYNMATGSVEDRVFFKNTDFHYCVIDEAHMLKNATSQRYSSMMKIAAKRRLLLTGTPLQNNLVELMSLLAFVMPEIFNGKGDLLKQTFKAIAGGKGNDRGNYEKECIKHAKNIMKPFVLRRLKSQVLKQLPKKIDIIHRCPMAVEQRMGYDACVTAFKDWKDGKTAKETNRDLMGNDFSGLNVLMKLRKWAQHSLLQRVHYTDDKLHVMSQLMLSDPDHVAANPDLIFEDMSVMSDYELHRLCKQYPVLRNLYLSDDIISDSGKFRMLDELLPEQKDKGNRVLLFSQFTMVLDIIEDYMKIRGYKFCRLDGSTPVVERQSLIDKFNSDESIFIFLLSTRAGGLGINLTAANTVILHDIDFNPYNDKQAEDRCHRVGQTRDVTVMRLLCENTIEESMYSVAERKLQLEEDVTRNNKDDEELDETDVAAVLREALHVGL